MSIFGRQNRCKEFTLGNPYFQCELQNGHTGQHINQLYNLVWKNDPSGKTSKDYSRTDPAKATGETLYVPEAWTEEGKGKGKGVTAPDLVGEVIGYKYFSCKVGLQPNPNEKRNRWGATDIHRINSPMQGTQWNSGNLIPDRITEREGGIYAYHQLYSLPPLQYKAHNNCWGIPTVIQAWGDLYVYRDGFRAQNAKLVLMSFLPDWPWEAVRHYRKWCLDIYGCKAVPYDELEENAKRYGAPVLKSLYPQ